MRGPWRDGCCIVLPDGEVVIGIDDTIERRRGGDNYDERRASIRMSG